MPKDIYGTLIFECEGGEVKRLGGWSASDRDAIGAAMSTCGIDGSVSNAAYNKNKGHREMNGWYIID